MKKSTQNVTENIYEQPLPAKKKRFQMLRASILCLLIFTFLCGIVYPLSFTLVAQTAYPYEANGSQIVVTLPNGEERIFGSELIGQSYESADLVTSGGSGVDPHISPEAAYFQVPVIVAARNKIAQEEAEKNGTEPVLITEDDVNAIIKKYTEGRFLGIFGQKRVNVLLVNLSLDGLL